jgi:hypothetical protein
MYAAQLPPHTTDGGPGQEVKTFVQVGGVQAPDWQVNPLLHYIS